jgi:hypothetical protein
MSLKPSRIPRRAQTARSWNDLIDLETYNMELSNPQYRELVVQTIVVEVRLYDIKTKIIRSKKKWK